MAKNPLNASKILFDSQENKKAFDEYAKLLQNLDDNATQTFKSLTAKSRSTSNAISKIGKEVLGLAESLKTLAGQTEAYEKQDKKVRELTLVLTALKKVEKETNIEREAAKKSQKEVATLNKEYTKNLKALTKENQKLEKQVVSITKKYDAQTKSQKAADNSLEKLRLETKEAEKAFKGMEGSLGKSNKEVIEAKNKFLLLKNELNKTNTALRQDVKTVNLAKDSYRSWEAAVSKASKELKELPDVLGKNAKKANLLKKSINANKLKLKEFDASIGNFQRNVGNYKSALSGVGAGALKMAGALGIAYGATELLGKIAVFAFEKFTKFEHSMAQVKAISGATSSEFKELESDSKRLGASTKFTADQVAGLQLEFAKKGFKTDEIINATEATLNLAEATGEDLAASADVASATLKGFGLKTSDTGRVVDVMAKSFSASSLNLEKFRESMKLIAPIAKVAGISIERATADVGKLADVGISGSSAGTALKNIYSELATEGSKLSKHLGFTVKNSDDAAKAFNLLSKQGIDLSKAQSLVGERSKAAFLSLINNSEGAEILTEKLENATGSARAMANVMRDTLQGSLDSLNSASEALAITLFDGVDGAFRGLVDTLTFALQGLNAFFGGLEGGLKTQEQFVKSISDEKAEINFLFESLKNSNLSHEERLNIVDKINNQYGEYLPNMVSEKDNNIEIAKSQDLVLKGKVKELILKREKAKIDDILVKKLEAQERLAKAQITIDRERAVQGAERNKQTEEQTNKLQGLSQMAIEATESSSKVISKTDEAASAISGTLEAAEIQAAKAIEEVKELSEQLLKIEGIDIKATDRDVLDIDTGIGKDTGKPKPKNTDDGLSEKETAKRLEEFLAELEKSNKLELEVGIVIDEEAFAEFSKNLEEKAQKEIDATNEIIKLGSEFDEEDFEAEDALEKKRSEAFLKRKQERLELLSLEQQQTNNIASFLKRNIKDERIRLAIELARLAASLRISKLKQQESGQSGATNGIKTLSFLNTLKLPSFATGVIDFKGKGTGTSDSNLINFSNGESVITEKATKASKALLGEVQSGRITDLDLPSLEAPKFNASILERKITIDNKSNTIDYDILAKKIGIENAKNATKIDIVSKAGFFGLSQKNGNHIKNVLFNAKALKYKI